jgi:hypothetical protein
MKIWGIVRGLVDPVTRVKKFNRKAVVGVLIGALIAVVSPSTAYAMPLQHGGRGSLSSSALLIDGPFVFINSNGKYLAASGNLLVVSTSSSNGHFYTVPDNGWVTLQHANGLNVNTSGNGTANGTRAVLSPGSGSFTQDWRPVPYGPDLRFVQFQNRAVPSRCLGISGGSSGTDVAIFNCENAPNQRWRHSTP